jgi:flagellar hook protein FlgE
MALIGTLNSGISALKAFTKDLEVIGNNIANVNTTAYKTSSVSMTDEFSNTLQASSNSVSQVGTGTKMSEIKTNFTQGSLTSTGTTTDLGISGSGYFLVKDTSGTVFATRDGSFSWDESGNLVTASGMLVQGATCDDTGAIDGQGTITKSPASDYATGSGTPREGLTFQSVSIDRTGAVTEYYSDGTKATIGYVLLQQFDQQELLVKNGDGLYSSLDAALGTGDKLFSKVTDTTELATYEGGASGNGTIESGRLELSNVDLTEQFAAMITAQRSFQAASRLVTVSDAVLEEIVNLKR